MIGVNTSIFKSAGRKLVNLLGALKDRATYYENGTDSVAEKNRIDDLGVLDKATILLTPTATSDARVHSVKTYTGEELVANGNFEGLGDEKVVNGTFSANSNWINVGSNGWTIDTNEQTANYTNASTYIFQSISTVQNKAYKVVLDIEHTSGILLVKSFNAQTIITVNTPGRQTLTGYFTEEDTNVNFGFIPNGSNVSGKIHSVSVKEVSDWTLGTGWTISDGKANATNTSININQNIGNQQGKKLKVEFDVNFTSGSYLRAEIGATIAYNITSSGRYSAIITPSTTRGLLYIYGDNFTGSIDNVSVKDVSSDFDFDRASSATRINSDGLVQDMQSITDPELVLNGDFEELGDEEVTNGTFDTDSDWSATNGATITGGVLNIDYNLGNGSTTQLNVFTIGKTYKIKVNVNDSSTGTARIDNGVPATLLSNGLNTFYIEATGTTLEIRNHVNFIGSIDNVSVQQVDPNDRWTLGTSWSIGDGKATSDGGASYLTSSSSFRYTIGNTYKVSLEITEYNRGSVSLPFDGTGVNTNYQSSSGVKTAYIVAGASNPIYIYSNGFDGKIDNVSVKDVTFSTDVDLARINYDSNGDNGHILLEPTSTNLITYSEDFSQSAWSKVDVLIEGGYTAPDGSNNAYKVTKNGSNAHLVGFNNQNTSRHKSIWAKTVSGTGDVYLLNQNTNNVFSLTNEWQRFDVAHTGANWFYAVDFRNSALTEVIVWGAQLEALPYATSYIPTLTGSTVTRAVEKLTGSGNSTLIDSRKGVLYAEIAGLVDDDSTSNSYHRVISISDNSTTNRVELKALNDGTLEFRFDSSSSDIRLYHASFDFTIFNKIALVWESGRCAAYLNGVKVVEDLTFSTFSSNALYELAFDSPYDGGSNLFYGKCKALAVFNEALEDDELELLTGVTNYGSFGELASANGYTII